MSKTSAQKPKPIEEDKGGRPSKFEPRFCEMLVKHMAEGLSFESFAGVIDVARSTLYEWKDDHTEFSDALERGVAKSQLYWEKIGRDHILNTSEYHKDDDGSSSSKTQSLNSAVYNLNMINRFKWKKEAGNDVQVNNNNFSNVSKEELERRAEDLAKKILAKKKTKD